MAEFLYTGRHFRIARVLLCLILMPAFSPAQKFHFQNYNVQHGLIQSQVIAIAQDHSDNLWFCTLGGISRFDGKSFTNFGETDGLISNSTTSILIDHESNIWIGTSFGLSRLNGSGFKNFKFSGLSNGNKVNGIVEDNKNRIWVSAGWMLYRIDNEKPVLTSVTGMTDTISPIETDAEGVLCASVYGKGIYRLEDSGWKLLLSREVLGTASYQKIIFDRQDKNKLYVSTDNSIFALKDGVEKPLIPAGSHGKISGMYLDKSNRLWFTGSRGLFKYSDTGLTSFNQSNGFEGNNPASVFQDRENNFWFGTNGTGVFRYSYQPFLIFDQFSEAKNAGIMPIQYYKGRIYFGTDGAGLFMYDGNKITTVEGIYDHPADEHILSLHAGDKGELYILASSGIYLKYVDGKITRVSLGDIKGCIYDVLPDGGGGFWVGNCTSLSHVTASGKTVRTIHQASGKILRIQHDSVLVATDDGLYVVAMNDKYRKINDSLFYATNFLALDALGKYYLIATANKGFVIYNSISGRHKQFTTKDGLNADFIYSIATDRKNNIWLGTGRGVNKVVLDTSSETVRISSLSIPGDISSSECNQVGALYDDNKNLWIGTVNGLFKFLPDSNKKEGYLPPVILQEVQVLSETNSAKRFPDSQNKWYSVPKDLVLSHNENHLTFTFRCLSYLHSESIQYQYRLEGMEKSYSALSPIPYVVYPSLPPGHYVFEARAFLEGIGYSQNNVSFPFEIKAAFYQTLYFKFLMFGLFLGIILGIQWMRIRMREKRIYQIEEVKREENIRVRQTASEDFHDEVGNSLTRIQVLTDVLDAKLGDGYEEEKRIIGQIKENASGLYQGTRDILWALNPESDLVKEIGHRLESLGVDVFQDTGICFRYENLLGQSGDIKLPGNFNRNIMMIFKEAMSNCLKHAQPGNVGLKIRKSDFEEILIELSDNGVGFNPLFVKRGHGFQNMQKRANRINAAFNIESSPGEGARYTLSIPVLT
jgi:signal transduction histidine kinase/ligand-binding sensor domain-containing protein